MDTPAGSVATIIDRASAEEDPTPSLDEKALRERLTLRSKTLIGELYELARRQVDVEVGKQARLDAKATSLLTVAGLALTVVSTVVFRLVSAEARPIFSNPVDQWLAIVGFAGAVSCGMVAAILAVWALRVRADYLYVNEETVFDVALLREADTLPDEADGLADYQQALTVHLWLIGQRIRLIQEQKARSVMYGQRCFLAFLVLLLSVCILLVVRVS